MNAIDKKIEELQKLKTLHQRVKKILPDGLYSDEIFIIAPRSKKHLTTVMVKVEDLDEMAKWIKKIKPSNEKTIISGASTRHVIDSSYRIDTNNPPQVNSCSKHEIKIKFTYDKLDIQVTMPVDKVKHLLTPISRKIFSTEYHYFPGMSQRKIGEMRVLSFGFGILDLAWYGGNRTCMNVGKINEIIMFIKRWNTINWTQINNSPSTGHPRFVCHFLNFAKTYEEALYIAKKMGGKKYHNTQYGGGIAFEASGTQELDDFISAYLLENTK